MQSDFNNVETELRDIEETFTTGRMNAFGSASTQDAFVHELKRIAEIETQVFYRTCALLKSSHTNEHKLVTNMYASAQPPPQSQRSGPATTSPSSNLGDGSFRANSSGLESSMYRGSMNQRSQSSFASTVAGGLSGVPPSNSNTHSTGASWRQSRQGWENVSAGSPFPGVGDGGASSGAAPHIHRSEWGNEDGFADKAFEDVAAHFEELESQFFSLGDYLREISKHVIRLNDMSKQVNNGVSYGASGGVTGAPAAAANANGSSNNTDMLQTVGSMGRQDYPGSFVDPTSIGGGSGYGMDGPHS
ncbi:hypothetical protein conserved [Leishmania donovani]|nr:hypothetical protein, conserved [Leishmania donovani]AYU77130.1 hypothetical protein LdCL_130010600 [Leishmania donovani]TPP50116.1 hypothetical protein CGC20_17315 [Leishmania donovani]CAJ1987154.1 hypothetical protein conserved [Leishmania donovani]CBZ32551.1 hypothetical protein, conserved [Leishmania donovani]VDZ43043.1 hypothetical_protein_conserved [Leishmania donovani]